MMKPDKGRARVPINNYDDHWQTSISPRASQQPPQKGNSRRPSCRKLKRAVCGRSQVNLRFDDLQFTICHREDAALQCPWAAITHMKKSGVCITMWITHPISTPIEEKSAHRSRARASASGSGRAGHGGRDTYENDSQSGKAEPYE